MLKDLRWAQPATWSFRFGSGRPAMAAWEHVQIGDVLGIRFCGPSTWEVLNFGISSCRGQ